jgi:hypothetical protein
MSSPHETVGLSDADAFKCPSLTRARQFRDQYGTNIMGQQQSTPRVPDNETAAWAAGARIGAVVAPRVLTYFDGGWTQARYYGAVGYNLAIARGGPTGLSLAAQTYNG